MGLLAHPRGAGLGFSSPTYPHKDEQAGVSHSVLALGDLDHGKLVWAGAPAQDLPYLKSEKARLKVKDQALLGFNKQLWGRRKCLFPPTQDL